MKTRVQFHSPEILETRIAPAVFLVYGNNLDITDSGGCGGDGGDITGKLGVDRNSDFIAAVQARMIGPNFLLSV